MAGTSVASSERSISFGPFRLVPAQRLLLEDDNPVRVGSRALDILTALVERPGELVGKHELMARVWRGTFVEEGNLKFQVGALRRALGDGRGGRRYIATSPGQGYRFVAPVSVAEMPWPAVPSAAPTRQNHNLPQQLTRLIGRADAVSRIVARLPRHRLLSIVGPGGIGKTSVAFAAAEASVNTYEHGIWFIDLAPLAEARLVPSAVAQVLGFDIRSDDPVPGLVGALRDRRLALVLDNCSHVIEAAAALAVAILRGAAGVHILATSREPLRVEGEHVQRLPPLASGLPSDHPGAAEALAFPAVELFVERAAECLGEFELSDENAPLVAEICRKLDGIPLAIELAAARVESFGVRGLATHLDDRFRLLTSGRRSGPPRHRTLRAALDWSYDVLSKPERAVLRRLGIFIGGFTLDAACAIAADPGLLKGDVIDAVAELVEKSLAAVETTETEPRLRLLETTRAYALERLGESGEREAVARRHAIYYRDLLETLLGDAGTAGVSAWSAPELDNIRAALGWAFSPAGDAAKAVALAAASAAVWFELSLWTECHLWSGRALAVIGDHDKSTRKELVLQYAFGSALMFTRGLSDRAQTALERADELAEILGDVDYRLRALAALAASCHRFEQFAEALEIGRRAEAVALGSGDPVALSTAHWILGTSLLFVGNYREALDHAARTRRATAAPAVRRAHIVGLGRDGFISASCTMANGLWALGLFDKSAHLARDTLAEALRGDHPFSSCTGLTWCGCVIPLWLGDLETAEHSIAHLNEHAQRHDLSAFHAYSNGFEGQLYAARGEFAAAERLLRSCLDILQRARNDNYPGFLISLAEVLARAGRADEGLAAAREVVERIARTRQLWWLPEALRVEGEVLLQMANADRGAAEEHLHRSLDLARRQEALAWELRAATSLARLLRNRDRIGEARDLLVAVYGRFTEGFGTADLQAAKRLIDALS
jgi:predicted ATPase/DNA-binding winged helix-turn-helix (wHTH) protein